VTRTAGQKLLDCLRRVEMALAPPAPAPTPVKPIAARCFRQFPHAEWQANRELAILLTHFRLTGALNESATAKLLDALLTSGNDRQQQIHYFYCLRLLHAGWNPANKKSVAAWYEGTKMWTGGHSFTPFLENIFRECLAAYTPADRRAILTDGEQHTQAALVLAQRLQNEPQPELLPDLKTL